MLLQCNSVVIDNEACDETTVIRVSISIKTSLSMHRLPFKVFDVMLCLSVCMCV